MLQRVVIINDNLRARGGAEALAIESARLFRDLGIPVTFVTGDKGNADEFRSLGIEVVEIGGLPVLKAKRRQAFVNGLYFSNSRNSLATWIFENDRPGTIYHVHAWSKTLSPSIFAALSKVAVRTVLHAHDFFAICPNGGFMNYPADATCLLVPMSVSCLTTNCDKRSYSQKLWRVARMRVREHYLDLRSVAVDHILVHKGMAPFFFRYGVPPGRLFVIPNPSPIKRTSRILAEMNDKIVFIGRLDPEKGPLDAARAARAAGVKLCIIGDGPLRGQLEADFPEIEMPGWCTADEISEHLAQARLLVVPSRWQETFGLAAIEALRLGVPIIVSDKALIAADVALSKAGISIDTSNIPKLTDAFSRLVSDNAAVKAMSERAMAAADSLSLSPENWRDALLTHYDKMLARSCPNGL